MATAGIGSDAGGANLVGASAQRGDLKAMGDGTCK